MSIKFVCDDCGKEIRDYLDKTKESNLHYLRKMYDNISNLIREIEAGTKHFDKNTCIVNYVAPDIGNEYEVDPVFMDSE